MPPVRPRKPAVKEERKRFGWHEIRISYLTLKVWGVLLLLVIAGAVGNILYARSHGRESLVGRIFAVARRSVDRRINLMTGGGAEEELLEQRYAMLSFFSGKVEIQRATDLKWGDAREQMKLAAGDRVRTFSNSRAEVSFDDGNVLRIKPDSLIVIGDLTENVRTKVRKSSVRLLVSSIEADIKKSVVRGSQFKLELPTAVAEIERARLAVEIRKDNQSQVRVYSGQVALDTGEQKVQVTDRSAVMISALRQVTAPESLLAAPRLRGPAALETFPTSTGGAAIDCLWDPVAGARQYRIEVAGDRFFDKVVAGREDVAATVFRTPALGAGIYHIRVAALDAQGRAGEFSEPVPVRVVVDRVPPLLEVQKFLVLQTPRGREVLLNGRTEPGVTLTAGGVPVSVDESGYFSAVLRGLPASQGDLELVARDRAGNARSLRQGVQS